MAGRQLNEDNFRSENQRKMSSLNIGTGCSCRKGCMGGGTEQTDREAQAHMVIVFLASTENTLRH